MQLVHLEEVVDAAREDGEALGGRLDRFVREGEDRVGGGLHGESVKSVRAHERSRAVRIVRAKGERERGRTKACEIGTPACTRSSPLLSSSLHKSSSAVCMRCSLGAVKPSTPT